jgi:folate-binding protein YgfZ
MSQAADDSQFLRQYSALATGCGLVELADWSSVSLTDGDRVAFLHNFCTNDIRRLQPGDACEAFVTDVKGKTLGHCLVTCRDDELVLVTVPGQASRLIEHLDRYLIREDVTLVDTTAKRRLGLLVGVAPGEISLDAAEHQFACNWLAPRPAVLVDVPRDDRFPSDPSITPCDWDALEAVRIEAGFPLLGVDFDATNLPQEIGRDAQAISFTKGCYLGQETVARIDALGHVNRVLVGVQLTGAETPVAGFDLSAGGEVVGRATSIAYSPKLGAPLALAMVRRQSSEVGSRLDGPSGPCEVVSLPVVAT